MYSKFYLNILLEGVDILQLFHLQLERLFESVLQSTLELLHPGPFIWRSQRIGGNQGLQTVTVDGRVEERDHWT